MNEHPTEQLAAYFDNELNNGEMAVVSKHVAGCALCQEELASFRALQIVLAETDSVPVRASAAEFWQHLQPRLRARRPQLGVGWLWGLFMALGAALGEIVLLGMFAAGIANRLGFSVVEPLTRVEPGLLGGLSNPVEIALNLVLENTLIGPILQSPIGPLLPALFVIALTAGLTFSFLGWGFAALQRSQPVTA